MKYLITGGAGFIGSNFIRYFFNKYPDMSIINLDKLTYSGNLENIRDFMKNKNYIFVKGDVCDGKLVNKIMKNIDVVIHFAAETHVDRSILSSGVFVKTDVLGTQTLLEAAKINNVKKFIHISTDEVYGNVLRGYADENYPLKPSSPYSASKAGADRLAYAYYATYKLPVIITRSSNNYGPYQHPEKFIPLFITNAMENMPMPLYGNGLNKRDWLHVKDNCEAIDLVLNRGIDGEVYNIGSEEESSNIEIAKNILKILKKSYSLIKFVKDRPGHDIRYAINCHKIKKLGWRPKVKFEKGLKNTIKWYSENRNWWRAIKKGSFKSYYKKQYSL